MASRQDQLEGFHHDVGIHTRGAIRIGIGPLLRGQQRFEFGDDQAAGKPGRAWVIAVDGRVRPSEDQTALAFQLLQACQVCRASAQTVFQGVLHIGGNDRVEHLYP